MAIFDEQGTLLPAAWIERARAAAHNKQPDQARALLAEGLKQHPDDADLHAETGRLMLALKQLPQAEAHLARALQARPEAALLHCDLGDVFSRRADWSRAAACYGRALALEAGQARAAVGLANALHPLGRNEEALAALAAARAASPGHPAVLQAQVDLLTTLDRAAQALALLDPEIGKAEMNLGLFERWCQLMQDAQRTDELTARLQTMTGRAPHVVELWLALGRTLAMAGHGDASYQAYARANTLRPDDARILFDLGAAERFRGNIEASHEWMARALQADAGNAVALRMFGMEHRYRYGDAAFVRLNQAAAGLAVRAPKDRLQLHFALGKAFDDVEELGTAFAHFAAGGKLRLRADPFHEKESIALAEAMKRVVTAEALAQQPEAGCASDKPVFILGMPRSGTSLVEQMLASHPAVYGAGELKLLARSMQGVVIGKARFDIHQAGFWPLMQPVSLRERGERYVAELEKLAGPAALRITDKMPTNFMFAGMIAMALPNARIIHTRRHPVETCLSCYRLLFGDGHQWSFDLRLLGRFYRRYWDLMAHWREQFPGRMLEIRYEDSVSDFEGQARRIVDYLGLAWTDDCLRFFETERSVRTASASQVRKPIYNTSTNRWRRYEKHLGPLLEEIGDLVEEYEAELTASAL
jgi:tetratricopeptide (TPR) repeat protein